MSDKAFVDTNIFLYLLSNDDSKKEIAKNILKTKPHISTQVINEFSNVCLKRFNLSIQDLKVALNSLIANTTICQISHNTTIKALDLKEK